MYQGAVNVTHGERFGDGLPQTPGFNLEERGSGRYRLDVCSDFAPGWLARLSAGLSGHQVSIQRGLGRRVRASRWQATFEIVMEPSTGDPGALDWQGLIDSGAQSDVEGCLELSDYRIGYADGGVDDLWVEVEGADKIGFLQHVLKSFALFSLFPSELQVETVGDTARDRFVLRGIAGAAPSAEAVQGLKELFDAALLR